LNLRDATDEKIFFEARAAGAVVITKDSDFMTLSLRLGAPPAILWLTCGNCGNARLRELFDATFADCLKLFEMGEAVVELQGVL